MPISLSGSLVLTGSITTTGGITISGSILSASYSATSSFSNDFTVLGNLTVFGTQSVQYITSSQLNISDNVITVNVASPGVRFGGLAVFDSGSQSSEATASLFWDSQENHWIYQRESGSTYNGGMLISGPRNSAGLGNESGTTSCMLLVGQGGDHLTSSMIYHDTTCTNFYSNALFVSSSRNVAIGANSPSAYGTQRFLVLGNGAASQVARFTDGANADLVFDNPCTGITRITAQYGTDGTLAFAKGTGFSETMRISSSGNVGIGTITPTSKLVVQDSNPENCFCSIAVFSNSTPAPRIHIKDEDGTLENPAGLYSDTGYGTGIYNLGTGINSGVKIFTGTPIARRLWINCVGIATFSCQIQTNGGNITINRTDGTPAILQLGNTSNGFQIQYTCTGGQRFAFFNGAPSEIASFYGTGVACFAGRVLASNSGVDAVFQDAFVGVYSGNANEQNAIQTSVSSNASNSGFLFMVSCGAGLSTRSCGYKMVRNSHTFYTDNNAVAYIESGMLASNGAGCFKSRSDARVLYLRQSTVNTDNIVQFLDHNGTNIWELVGRNQQFYIYNGAIGNFSMCINPNTNAVHFPGAVSKGSGTFNIEHPLDSKKCTHRLVHSFIEGPQADLIYRGKINLDNGIACVNIDCSARMTEGTFEALNRCAQVFTTNESSWDAIKGKLHGNILVIESQNTESNDEISWMVIGERQDKHIKDTSITDSLGRIITEPEVEEQFTCVS